MKQVTVVRYDAFADRPGMGNPCGVVFEGASLTDREMQAVAQKAGFTECAFLCPSQAADLRLRFFMPAKETPLCGHGTVCALSALMERQNPASPLALKAETLAGMLDVGYDPATGLVTMQQAPARFEPFEGDLGGLLSAVGLGEADLDRRWPVLYGSTGSWTLLLPIRELAAFGRMRPQNHVFASLLGAHPDASVHPFCTQTLRPGCALHGRHFSSTSSGSVEDPVTGTACGVMGAYYLAHMAPLHPDEADSVHILIEQGQDMGRDGVVQAWAWREGEALRVKIAGRAVAGQPFPLTV